MRAEKENDHMMEMLRAWYEYYSATGFVPSYAELAKLTEIGSKSTVHRYLALLSDAGYIKRQPGSPRAVQLTAKGREYLEGVTVSD